MDKYTILKELDGIVKDSVIEFHSSDNYPIFFGEDGSLYKNNKEELIWYHYGEDFEVEDLNLEEFSLLFDLLLSNKAITYNEYTYLVSHLL